MDLIRRDAVNRRPSAKNWGRPLNLRPSCGEKATAGAPPCSHLVEAFRLASKEAMRPSRFQVPRANSRVTNGLDGSASDVDSWLPVSEKSDHTAVRRPEWPAAPRSR
jgi:hypothetical protein